MAFLPLSLLVDDNFRKDNVTNINTLNKKKIYLCCSTSKPLKKPNYRRAQLKGTLMMLCRISLFV